MTKHEQAIAFADKHIDLPDDEFWPLAEEEGLTEDDFVETIQSPTK